MGETHDREQKRRKSRTKAPTWPNLTSQSNSRFLFSPLRTFLFLPIPFSFYHSPSIFTFHFMLSSSFFSSMSFIIHSFICFNFAYPIIIYFFNYTLSLVGAKLPTYRSFFIGSALLFLSKKFHWRRFLCLNFQDFHRSLPSPNRLSPSSFTREIRCSGSDLVFGRLADTACVWGTFPECDRRYLSSF